MSKLISGVWFSLQHLFASVNPALAIIPLVIALRMSSYSNQAAWTCVLFTAIATATLSRFALQNTAVQLLPGFIWQQKKIFHSAGLLLSILFFSISPQATSLDQFSYACLAFAVGLWIGKLELYLIIGTLIVVGACIETLGGTDRPLIYLLSPMLIIGLNLSLCFSTSFLLIAGYLYLLPIPTPLNPKSLASKLSANGGHKNNLFNRLDRILSVDTHWHWQCTLLITAVFIALCEIGLRYGSGGTGRPHFLVFITIPIVIHAINCFPRNIDFAWLLSPQDSKPYFLRKLALTVSLNTIPMHFSLLAYLYIKDIIELPTLAVLLGQSLCFIGLAFFRPPQATYFIAFAGLFGIGFSMPNSYLFLLLALLIWTAGFIFFSTGASFANGRLAAPNFSSSGPE